MINRVEFELDAIEDLDQMSPVVRDRILRKINWLALNFEQSAPQSLKSNLSGFYKLRIGDYRVIYEVEPETQVLVVVRVGHRREIYDQ